MNDDRKLVDGEINEEGTVNAPEATAATVSEKSVATTKSALRRRCAAALCAFAAMACIVTGAIAAGLADSERDYGYSVDRCRVLDVFSDGSCVYVLVAAALESPLTAGTNRTLCAVPASVATRSTFGASPACFAPNADESTLSAFERRQNDEDARVWASALNSSVLCALPRAVNDTRELSECGELALANGLLAEAYRAWSPHLALVATDARLLHDALDASTRIERTSGWASIVFGLLLGVVSCAWFMRTTAELPPSRARYVPFHVRRARWQRATRHLD